MTLLINRDGEGVVSTGSNPDDGVRGNWSMTVPRWSSTQSHEHRHSAMKLIDALLMTWTRRRGFSSPQKEQASSRHLLFGLAGDRGEGNPNIIIPRAIFCLCHRPKSRFSFLSSPLRHFPGLHFMFRVSGCLLREFDDLSVHL